MSRRAIWVILAGALAPMIPVGAVSAGSATVQDFARVQRKPVPQRVAMPHVAAVPRLQQAERLGPHAASDTIRLTVSLKLRNVQGLKTFLQRVQNPRYSEYHHFLTPAEFTARYGPTQQQVDAVVAFLKKNRVKVLDVSPNRLLIHTKATTEAYEHALELRIDDYKLDGRSFFSSEDRPKLPASMASYVQGILGLDNAVRMRPMHRLKPLALKGATPNVSAAPPPSAFYFNPFQIAKAYDWPVITDASNGAAVTIAIVTADSSSSFNMQFVPSDYQGFWSAFGLPAHDVDIIQVPFDQGNSDGISETLLDMEWAGAMAPGAKLDVYIATDPSFSTFTDTYNRFVTDNTAQVMTTSWGAPEYCTKDQYCNPNIETDDAIFMQAAAQGISMFAAAGDAGSSECRPALCPPGDNNADYPSSSPWITAANGTQLKTDVAGNYVSETAWSHTGGAVSKVFNEPSWQTGAGVPENGWRNNSDLAMNAGCNPPYLLLNQGQWGGACGTSAVAPQLAGLFAVAVSQNGGERLGQSNSLIYGDVNTGHYDSDFRDVTTGSNGAFDAGSDWDHPTGWGSPRATSLVAHLGIHGPSGTLAGTITDAASGAPIPNVKVTIAPNNLHLVTADDGTYTRDLAVGDYTLSTKIFGYKPGSASVTIGDDETTTRDFALQPQPNATVSGHVTDGSGHGYGLYAEIEVTAPDFGEVADVWSDPATGAYSVKLPKGSDYTFTVTSYFNGYNPGNAMISGLSKNTTKNFALTVGASCQAPGYRFVKGFGEDFNGADFPPAGWVVETPVDNGGKTYWALNTTLFYGNLTSGSGTAAMAYGSIFQVGAYDTQLITPPIAVTALPAAPLLVYKANYQGDDSTENALDLDISSDGGANWTNVLHWSTKADDCGGFFSAPGCTARVPLAQYLPSSGSIQLRWRYYNTDASAIFAGEYAQIDDVSIGTCQPTSVGPVLGQVTDANSGEGIVGATVGSDVGASTRTFANARDPNLPAGYYFLFLPTGKRTLNASSLWYTPESANVNVNAHKANLHDFSLDTGHLAGTPQGFDLHLRVNHQATRTLTLENAGSAAAHYTVLEAARPHPPTSTSPPAVASTPPLNGGIANAKGLVSAVRLYSDYCDSGGTASGVCVKHHGFSRGLPREAASAGSADAGSIVSWFAPGLAGTSMNGLGIDRDAENLWVTSCSYCDPGGDDKAYQFLFDGTVTGATMNVRRASLLGFEAGMAYDDNTGMFWQIGINSSTAFCIYEENPNTGRMTGNRICPNFNVDQVALAYDPLTNTWYAGDLTVGLITHFDTDGRVLATFSAGFPIVGLVFNSGTGHLFALAESGFGFFNIYVLDPSDHYKTLDTFNFSVQGAPVRIAINKLTYDCKGNLWGLDITDNLVVAFRSGETGWCAFKQTPWLSEAPVAGTVNAGKAASVTLAFDGAGEKAFTTSRSRLLVRSDTPYGLISVPVTVHWDPQPVDLAVTASPSPSSVAKGGNLVYTVTVENEKRDDHGSAHNVELNYALPAGVSFIPDSGAGGCKAESGTVACALGDIALGASKTVTIAVNVGLAGELASTFTATADEPQKPAGGNQTTVKTTVIGSADLSVKASNGTVPEGGDGTIKLAVSNAGPDSATGVRFKLSAGGSAKLTGAASSQGSCTSSGNNGFTCEIGKIEAGGKAAVTLTVFGIGAGMATVQGQALTSASDPDQANNVATAQVTVKAASNGGGGNGGGGGALGWLALAVLLGLALAGVRIRDGD